MNGRVLTVFAAFALALAGYAVYTLAGRGSEERTDRAGEPGEEGPRARPSSGSGPRAGPVRSRAGPGSARGEGVDGPPPAADEPGRVQDDDAPDEASPSVTEARARIVDLMDEIDREKADAGDALDHKTWADLYTRGNAEISALRRASGSDPVIADEVAGYHRALRDKLGKPRVD